MQILIDIRLLGSGRQSGIEEYSWHLVNHLIQSQSEHQFILFYNGWRKAPLPKHWRDTPRVRLINWPCPNKIFDLLRPPIDLWSKVDLVYSPHLHFLRVVRAPRILTIHDLSFIHHPHFFSHKHRLWHKLQSIEMQVANAAAIITDSQYVKQDLIETFRANEEKIRVIYPGINKNLKQITCQRPPNLDFPYLLYLGTIEPRKNISLIIAAFNLLKDKSQFQKLKLVLAGSWGWLYEKVAHDIHRSPYKNDIIVWGPVKNEEKILLYNLAEAFVYPSFFEGFGFPLLEAQACGCPVIASDRTSLPEVLDRSAILINPWKEKELALAIEKVLEDGNLRDYLITEGFKNTKRFDWEKTTCELLNFFSRFSS